MAAGRARPLVPRDELRDEALVEAVHERAVAARLPRDLHRALDVRHVRDEGVRQRVADRPTQFSQAEGVQKGFHLVLNTHRAVLQIVVVKTEARIDESPGQTALSRQFNLPLEELAHARDRIVVDRNPRHLPHIFPGHVTNDHSGIVFCLAIEGDVLVSGGEYGEAFVWSITARDVTATLEGHRGIVYSVAISGETVATASGDKTARIWLL